jgi:methylated-DNA-[protein]-cysteine S-methyltransferase
MIEIAETPSPVGELRLAVRDGQLCALAFADCWPRIEPRLSRRFGAEDRRPSADPAGVISRLKDWFDGDLAALDDVPLDLGGTPFQARVWEALRAVPPGRTASYRDIARAAGSPDAVRAVGSANGSNPTCIVVPCHRIIRSDGALGGYGGGLDRKRWLLKHEAAHTLSIPPGR